MAERVKGQREAMPEEGDGWVRIEAGSRLDVLYHPERLGHDDGILRKSIDVALRGKREQALRFDPFSVGAHYHIGPVPGEGQIPLPIADGQTPLEASLVFFEDGMRFRQLLADAEKDDNAGDGVTDADLARAAEQIRSVDAEHQATA